MAAQPLSGRVALVTGAGSPIGRAIAEGLRSAGWEVLTAVAELERVHGSVELLVTTRSEAPRDTVPFDAIAPDRWQAALDGQLRMVVHAARAVLPAMVENGRGQIVAVTSASALDGGVHEAHTASADGATIGLIKGLAREYGPRGIAVNTLAPGEIAPERIARTVLFLAREQHYFAGHVFSPSEGRIL